MIDVLEDRCIRGEDTVTSSYQYVHDDLNYNLSCFRDDSR